MDIFSKEKRSEIMSTIRSKNTRAEILVFRELRRRNIYFQKHYRRARGNPDIAVPSKKIAIFIDGDFWHGRNFSKQSKRLPKKYWLNKIKTNIARDRKNREYLKKTGWKILKVWETDVLKDRRVIDLIASFVEQNQSRFASLHSMKNTKKNVVPKDIVRSHKVHTTAPPRMEPKAKDAGLRSKSNPLQKRKPKKNTKSQGKM